MLCFVMVMQSLIMNSHEVFIHIHQGCFAGTGAIVRLPQCQWIKPDGNGKTSQCMTTTKHSKAKTVRIFLGIYCTMTSKRAMSAVVSQITSLTIVNSVVFFRRSASLAFVWGIHRWPEVDWVDWVGVSEYLGECGSHEKSAFCYD